MPGHQKPHFQKLKNKWISRHRQAHKVLWEKHKDSLTWLQEKSKHIALGSAASLLMLTHSASSSDQLALNQHLLPAPTPADERPQYSKEGLMKEFSSILPETVGPLTDDQNVRLSNLLTTYFQFPIVHELEGKRLNRTYGIIGAEQHLMRYPGDTMETHFDTAEEATHWSSGMAPGRGAWGYFANSRADMTEQDKMREKYYIAVQTFLSPGWRENPNELYKFFQYRKMLILNPENGKAVVAVIGDAGPAEFTGKQLGGSPEVMAHLERVDGGAKGPVLYFFIDDPEDKIPLGPLEMN